MDILQIIKKSIVDLKIYWGVMLLASLPLALLPSLFAVNKTLALLAILILSGPLKLGLSKISLAIVRKQSVSIQHLFDGFLNFKNALGVFLLSTVFTIIGLFAFIIPGIVIALFLSQSYFLLVDNSENEPLEIFKLSRNLIKGYELKFLTLLLVFISITLLLFFSKLSFLSIALAPIQYISTANFYMYLKENAK